MTSIDSPRKKIVVLISLFAALTLILMLRRFDLQTGCRTILIAAALLVTGYWFKARPASSRKKSTVCLTVMGQTAVSPRCKIALIEVQGSHYLLAHGEGFAQLHLVAASHSPKPSFSDYSDLEFSDTFSRKLSIQ